MIIEENQDIKLEQKIQKLKEKYSPEELKSILNFVKDPTIKFILTKLLLENSNLNLNKKNKTRKKEEII